MTKEELLKLARLARLELDPSRLEKLGHDLNSIFSYMKELETIDVSAVQPMSHVHGSTNVFRNDEVVPSLSIEESLKNAPDTCGHYLRVPLIIE